MNAQKVDFGEVETPVLFVSIYGPKFTKLSLRLQECLQFAKPISDERYFDVNK